MSVTNRCKVLTLSGAQCFALVRAMRVRATFLQHQIEHASYDHEPEEIRDYLLSQLEETNLVLEKIEATPFTEVLS